MVAGLRGVGGRDAGQGEAEVREPVRPVDGVEAVAEERAVVPGTVEASGGECQNDLSTSVSLLVEKPRRGTQVFQGSNICHQDGSTDRRYVFPGLQTPSNVRADVPSPHVLLSSTPMFSAGPTQGSWAGHSHDRYRRVPAQQQGRPVQDLQKHGERVNRTLSDAV